jgi:hypothetical protein
MKRFLSRVALLVLVLCGLSVAAVQMAPIPHAAAVTSCPPNLPPEITCAWHPTFDDEFSGHQIDWSKWQFGWPAGWSGAAPLLKSNCSEGNGLLYETAINHPYSSCVIYSRFEQSYGFFEFRSKMPAGVGFWPSAWLFSYSNGPEQDVMEQRRETNNYNVAYRWSFRSWQGVRPYNTTLHTQFHIYSVLWIPGRVTFYFDNHPVLTVTKNISSTPLRIIFQFLIDGPLAGNPTPNTHFPSSFVTDWVRVYSMP